jgi:hypothetical protein
MQHLAIVRERPFNLKGGLWFFSKKIFWFPMFYVLNIYIRDWPFDLKGGLWFFVSFRIFFSDNTSVRIFIFLVAQSAKLFPVFNIRLYMYWQFLLLFVYKQERSNHTFSMNESNDEKKSSIRTGSIN